MRLNKQLKVAALSCAFVFSTMTLAGTSQQESLPAQEVTTHNGDMREHMTATDLLPRLAELTGKRVVAFGGSGMVQPIVIFGSSDVSRLPLEAIYTAFIANDISTVETADDIVVGHTASLIERYAGFPVIGPAGELDRSNPSALIVKIFSFADAAVASAAGDYLYEVIDGGTIAFDKQRAQLAVLGPVVQCAQIEEMLSKSAMTNGFNAPFAAKLVSVSFAGGTVSEYVSTLEEVHPKLSVLVESDAGSLLLPAIKLHDVSVQSALMVLTGLSPAGNDLKKIDVMAMNDETRNVMGEPVFQIALHDHTTRGRNTNQFVRRTNELGLGAGRDWNVWSLRTILTDQITSEDVLATMADGLAMVSNDGREAELTFDKKTGLLMAAGTPAQVLMVNRMIDNMQ